MRKFSPKCHDIPKDSKEDKVQEDTSIERQHNEIEVSPESPNRATSLEYQRKDPIRMVKVKSRKCRYASKIWRKFHWKCCIVPKNSPELQVQAGTTTERPKSEIEVSYAPSKSADSTVDQRNPPVRAMKVIFKKHRCDYPDGVPVPESRHTMVSTMAGSYIPQVGDTDIGDQQNLDSIESFPDAFEIQQWELKKKSSTENPVLNVLFLAPPNSSDEDVVIIKKRKKRGGATTIKRLQYRPREDCISRDSTKLKALETRETEIETDSLSLQLT
ncbi:hypothetical protein LEMLEM_LOCUS22517 [Lemmus lemmus]